MKLLYKIFIIYILGLNNVFAEDKNILTIYSTDSFSTGNVIKNIFEKEYNVKVKFVSFDHATSIVSRLKFEGDNTKADIVLGLDSTQISSDHIRQLFTNHNINIKNLNNLPIIWQDDFFVPYNYGYLTFIYRADSLKKIPVSFREMINSKENFKIAIADPRSSTIGYDLLLWTLQIFGDDFEKEWKNFSKKISIFAKGWAEAWSLCMLGEVDLVLSYDTSAGYHKSQNQEKLFKSLNFEEGHAIQMQVAAQVKTSSNKELAQKFLEFLLKPQIQTLIAQRNYMHPVIKLNDDIYNETIYENQKRKILFDQNNDPINHSHLIKKWINSII